MNPVSEQERQLVTPVLLWERKLFQKQCQPIEDYGEPLRKLHNKLQTSMDYYQGIGIAAPQIGEFVQFAIVKCQEGSLDMCNPEIVSSKGFSTEYEACLSLPGCTSKFRDLNNRAKVTRAKEIDLRWWDLKRDKHEVTFTGYMAHVIQHEIDHLSGLFFVDRCSDLARSFVMRNFENFKKALQDK